MWEGDKVENMLEFWDIFGNMCISRKGFECYIFSFG